MADSTLINTSQASGTTGPANTSGFDADFHTRLDNLIAASGGRLWIISGYRSTEEQTQLWNTALSQYGSEDAARQWVAPPGHSNHEKGIAADLGGDIELAHQLAPQFGLYFPMDWENWHIEPMGSRDNITASTDGLSPSPYTTAPPGFSSATSASLSSDPSSVRPNYGQLLSAMVGGPTYSDIFQPSADTFSRTSIPTSSLSPARANAPVYTSPTIGGPDGIDKFMAATRDHESGGDYTIEGTETPWGTATGAYQFLDGTWNGYKGYARAKDAPPAVQDEKARELMQTYYNKFGSWDGVAGAWFAGANGNFDTEEVQGYIQDMRRRMNG